MPIMTAFTLRTPDAAQQLVAFLRQHAGAMARLGTPLRVLVAKKMAERTLAQNGFMWAGVLDQVATQVCLQGQWFCAETWHDWLKQKCLPDTCARGVEKWQYHADGTRSLLMSTSDLDYDEFDTYLLEIQAHCAIEYGVAFTNREE